MEIQLLGNVEIHGRSRVHRLSTASRNCVLAALALQPGTPVPASSLVDWLWPPHQQTNESMSSLRRFVSDIRAAIEAAGGQREWLSYDRRAGTYRLDIDPALVDVHCFTSLAASARHSGDVVLFDRALALWHGEPLAGLDNLWAERRRADLKATLRTVQHHLFEALLAAGQPDRVIQELAHVVEDSPTDVFLVDGLRALAAADRHLDIPAWTRRLTLLMREVFDAEPAPASLAEAHRLTAESTGWTPPPVPSSSAPPTAMFSMVAVPPRRWLGVAVPIVCLTAFAIWLVLQFSQGDLDRGDKPASIVSMSVTIITLPLSVLAIVVTLRQRQPAKADLTLAERLDEMAEALTISVRSQWEAEEQVRRVHDPFPLPVRWTNAPEHLMDHWQTIHGSPEALILDGHGDHIVEMFNRVPSGRLVVLGRAGAGKTILTSRFVLTLLASRPLPVPVIFSLGSWDPTTSSLRDWLVVQLVTTYPILAERDDTGATVAAQLLTTGRVMPVLDGFDEISEGLRVDAIKAINAGLRLGDRLLLTSRIDEYAAVVQAGDVLTGAAVVRLDALTIADLTTYLPLTTRRTDADKWVPVIDHLRAGPSPLSEVLSTPLMVALARTIFSDTRADPAELLNATSVPKLEERLLSSFIPAAYSGARGGHASRWLGFLAAHLHRLDTYDLAWWRLIRGVPRLVIGLVAGGVLTVVIWLVTGLPVWLGGMPDEPRDIWLLACLGAGLLAGAAGGLVIAHGTGWRPPPGKVYLTIRSDFGSIAQALVRGVRSWQNLLWFAAWTVGGFLFGWAAQVVSGSATGLLFGAGAGLTIGIATWLIWVSVRVLDRWVDPAEMVNVVKLLRTDRMTALREGSIFGIGVSTVLWLVVSVVIEPASGLSFGVVFGHIGVWVLDWFVIATGAALIWMLFGTTWGPWLIARFCLPLTGRLPWSVMSFLADAHRRGALRQTGGVYQFRHASLQDHLAVAGGYRSGRTSTPEK